MERVVDKYIGEIAMLDSGDVIRVDQAELETVIPSPGGTVVVVNGPHVGRQGTLVGIDTDRFQAQVRLSSKGGREGTDLWMDYEDVCKLA